MPIALTCSPDGFTVFGILVLAIFLASMMGLFSKDKEDRQKALIGGAVVAIGSTIVIGVLSC